MDKLNFVPNYYSVASLSNMPRLTNVTYGQTLTTEKQCFEKMINAN